MNINHLRYFVDAVDLSSCSEAARKNRISQPALSQSIRNLESELGYEILNHRPKSFALTVQGESFLVYARQILELANKAKSELQKVGKEVRPVRIICTHSFFKYYLKPLLARIKQKNPNWAVSISFGDRERIQRSLRDNQVDIGFLLSPEKVPSFETKLLQKGFFYEISLSPKEENTPLYVTSYKDKEIKQSYKTKGKENVVEIGSWESIYELVDSKLGRGVVPDYIIKNDKMTKRRLVEYNMLMLEKKTKNRPCSEFAINLFNELRNLDKVK